MLLPVIIWRTLRNKNPVGPTGERGDKGQVSETRARSVTPGATLPKQPLPFLTTPSPAAGERSEEPPFHSWGEGTSPTGSANQRDSVPEGALLSTLTCHSGSPSQSTVCSFTRARVGCKGGWLEMGKGSHPSVYTSKVPPLGGLPGLPGEEERATAWSKA